MSKIYKDENTDEWFYPQDGYILSETDSLGNIIYASDLFCEIAGYKQEELIGEPHNVVRHNDMPRVAFKGLWDDLREKGFWTGYVKNRRKDGGYYWVFATALKKVANDGTVTYLSIRTAPPRSVVDSCEVLYADLRSKE
ncbi:MAG: PAS domain-containing protein [Campylobacterota bacterium]|nr:PAS domain-containing protein [Campylobacterota bacterium]